MGGEAPTYIGGLGAKGPQFRRFVVMFGQGYNELQ